MLTAMLDGKHRGRRKGVEVREGSVRQARQEAKLSLAQVAGDAISRTAIHLIETGRSRPSLETLELIARKTRKPVDFFLLRPDGAPELTERKRELDELERLIAMRDFQTVVALAPSLLANQRSNEDNALVHFYVGQAYCRLVRPAEAIEHLRPARRAFENNDEWLAVEAMDWEASALGLMEDPTAIALAAEAGVLLVVGSSLEVYPVAGLPLETTAAGGVLAIVNRGATQFDDDAEVCIDAGAGETLGALARALSDRND